MCCKKQINIRVIIHEATSMVASAIKPQLTSGNSLRFSRGIQRWSAIAWLSISQPWYSPDVSQPNTSQGWHYLASVLKRFLGTWTPPLNTLWLKFHRQFLIFFLAIYRSFNLFCPSKQLNKGRIKIHQTADMKGKVKETPASQTRARRNRNIFVSFLKEACDGANPAFPGTRTIFEKVLFLAHATLAATEVGIQSLVPSRS